ncbi:hypothetical protein niasHT_023770 [Heterodera trifolii]|uniref:Cation efflux protein cytoplasmic domain-containing protein n=1 Tax=Heterodera trifolii TaxID=157864 RepID=A0ABD2JNL2_9BILA
MVVGREFDECENGLDERKPLLQWDKQQKLSDSDPRLRISAKTNCFERKRRRKGLKEYYENQDRLLECYRQDEARLQADSFDADKQLKAQAEQFGRKQRMDRLLAQMVFLLNIVLLFANLAAAIMSGSYAIISAFIDNTMDLTSSAIVQLTVWAIKHTNMFNYPRGRERLEIVAVVVCSTIMGVTNIMMIIQSIQAILSNDVHPEATLITILLLFGGILSKLSLLVVCCMHNTNGARLLAMDLRNDVATSVVALGGAYLGDKFWPYADPIGAILVCSFIAISWFANVFSTIPLIVGRRAEQEQTARICRIAIAHDERIKFLDHVMVYHLGERALVELHVVLDETLTLKVTHDLCEALERKIRTLDFVDRVFLHVDYQLDGDR